MKKQPSKKLDDRAREQEAALLGGKRGPVILSYQEQYNDGRGSDSKKEKNSNGETSWGFLSIARRLDLTIPPSLPSYELTSSTNVYSGELAFFADSSIPEKSLLRLLACKARISVHQTDADRRIFFIVSVHFLSSPSISPDLVRE